MQGAGRQAQAFLTDGDGGVVDRLDINIRLLEQPIGDGFAAFSFADQKRDNMALGFDQGQAQLTQTRPQVIGLRLLACA